ncbi:T9SS type A sorting domain-containing protein, partial [Dolichospermum sp. ST_sed3]|nr:T9SS type A sorting domain-containing protein [Dolichospermum sp. ST_sed3]
LNEMITDVKNDNNQWMQFILFQNYPNPFNPSTSIQYAISSTQFVTLKVYDLLGREVATLVNEEKQAGSYEIDFQSTVGSYQLANGVYFYQLQAGDFIETKKMILLK